MFTNLRFPRTSRVLCVAVIGVAIGALPTMALADSRDFRDRDGRDRVEARDTYRDRDNRGDDRYGRDDRRDDRYDSRAERDRSDDRRDDRRVELPSRVWVEPVYRTVYEKKWVAPVYRTVNDRVWHEPVVRKETERVWVPDKYETRPVDPFGRTVALKKVLVKCGHYEERCREVVIKPGYFEECRRQELVCDGHFENVERQELVAAGHWADECAPIADRSEARLSVGWWW